MKSVLITGANSYIGTNVERWLLKEPDKYHVETLDMKDPNWVNFDFSKFDVVFHVAGIAHIKETKKNRDLYYKVNRDLAVETAKKAKEAGVSQFIFLSSMSVYGIDKGVITKDTIPKPKSAYGKSKLEAEQFLRDIEDDNFIINILRPPMVYGPGSPGNYQKLKKLAKYMRFIPKIENKRSVLEISNLSKIVELFIKEFRHGIFFPQDDEYLNTNQVIKLFRRNNNKKTNYSLLLTIAFKILMPISRTIKKLYGDLFYEKRI